MTDWKEGLDADQCNAASFVGEYARLLAGPGTGKTRRLIRRVLYLILEKSVEPSEILLITFTRVAAFQPTTRSREYLGTP
jgi:DNA helicase-2/ATP-dependent DNA helicase PcrA